ncbi:MAG: hypothetical protein ACFFCI_00545 [Promethearchaeota archaeon]
MSRKSSKQQQGTTITLSWFHVLLGVMLAYFSYSISVDVLENLGTIFFPELGIWAPAMGKFVALVIIVAAFVFLFVVLARRSRKQ